MRFSPTFHLLFSSVRAGDIVNSYNSCAPEIYRSVYLVVRGDGKAQEIPVAMSARLNKRTRKCVFCWLCSTTHWATESQCI